MTRRSELTATEIRQVRDLRGLRRKAAGVALKGAAIQWMRRRELPLAGEVLDHVCCLYGDDRMLSVWPSPDHVVVIAVGRQRRVDTGHVRRPPRRTRSRGPRGRARETLLLRRRGRPPADPKIATTISEATEHRARARWLLPDGSKSGRSGRHGSACRSTQGLLTIQCHCWSAETRASPSPPDGAVRGLRQVSPFNHQERLWFASR